MMRNAFLLCSAILLLAACQPENPNAQTLGFDLITPTFPGVKVPSETKSLDPAKGDTLKFALGAELRVPANALVNAKGEAVEGEVDIRFRQYLDPLDMAIAGINMQYDSAGSSFTFESAGMCEVRAFQNGQELFVKEGARLGMSLPSSSPESGYNLYVYDSLRQRWTYLEEDIETTKYQEIPLAISNLDSIISEEVDVAFAEEFPLPKPQKMEEGKVQIAVEVPDDVNLPELKIFNNTQFELLPEDTVYRDAHAEIDWNWAEVEATTKKGKYRLIFSTGSQEVAYLVRPVYESKDYEEALAIYESEKIKFEAERKRITKEAEKARIEANRIRAEAARQQYAALSESLQRQQAALQEQFNADRRSAARLARSFELDNFGTYNCDRIWTTPNEQVFVIAYLESDGPSTYGRLDFIMSQSNVKTCTFVGRQVKLPTDETFSIFTVQADEFYFLPKVDLQNLPRNENGNVLLGLKKFDGPVPSDYTTVRDLLEI